MADYQISVPDDIAALTDTERAQLKDQIDSLLTPLLDVQGRLEILTAIPAKAAALSSTYLVARDGEAPSVGTDVAAWPAYRPPTGAHDAYPAGYVVQVGGHLFRANRYGVVHSPAEWPPDWDDVTAELAGEQPPVLPTALPWTAGEAVKPPMKRGFGGVVYECIQPHVTQSDWTPPTTPALWKIALV